MELRIALAVLGGMLASGCNPGRVGLAGDGGASGPDASQQAQMCRPCLMDSDCGAGEVCAQFEGDIYCAPACGSLGECPADRACLITTSARGVQVDVCVPTNDLCGQPTNPPPDASVVLPRGDGGVTQRDAGSSSSETCGPYVGPDVPASCSSCSSSSSSCQQNGCYGGWWCDTATNLCHSQPSNCQPTQQDAGSGLPPDAAPLPPPTGTVGASGGTLSRLVFAVVGDTRPPSVDDTSGYPTSIITAIYQGIAGYNPMPPFVVSTGDYMFASTSGSQAGPQLDLYLAARQHYPGVDFPALGNHECTGATASNCGSGASDGVTKNYSAFTSKMLGPIGQTNPYYSINVDATDGSWTAKFVFVAANAWNSAQQSWLSQVMAQSTTYTFVVRHEPSSANTAPGVSPSDSILAAHPYTLLIVGHTHTYGRAGTRQVIVGNGGAPLTGSGNYGWALVQQRADGAIQVDMIDYQSLQPDTKFRFAVKADGTAAP